MKILTVLFSRHRILTQTYYANLGGGVTTDLSSEGRHHSPRLSQTICDVT